MKGSLTGNTTGSARRYAVIGAGNGGKAMAAHLAMMGFSVSLYNRTAEHIAEIKKCGGIHLAGDDRNCRRGFGRLSSVTSDVKEAVHNADIIMVVVPAHAHADVARALSCHLRKGQIVILHPGRTLGAVEFHQVLAQNHCELGVVIAEAQTFIYASRSDGPAEARIFKIKNEVPLAALPAVDTARVLAAVNPAYPQFVDGGNVLQTSLNNIGAIFHPTISLLNTGWIEATKGAFQFYLDGVTPTIAKIMEALDRERMAIASALGVKAFSICEWLKMAYNADGCDMHQAIHNQVGYRGINAPKTLRHRYLQEDVPMSLVPFVSLGRRFGVPVRGMESIINLACIAHGRDYWRCGRTIASLKIDKMTRAELKRYFDQGEGLYETAPDHLPGMTRFPSAVHEPPHPPSAAVINIPAST